MEGFDAFEPYELAVIVLYALGALMSLAFVLTWFPLAFRALAKSHKDVSLVRILDYAGLHLFVALSFSLVLRTLVLYGISAPPDTVAAFGRLFLPLGIDILVGIRLFRWSRKLWEYRHGADEEQILSGVSKGERATETSV